MMSANTALTFSFCVLFVANASAEDGMRAGMHWKKKQQVPFSPAGTLSQRLRIVATTADVRGVQLVDQRQAVSFCVVRTGTVL